MRHGLTIAGLAMLGGCAMMDGHGGAGAAATAMLHDAAGAEKGAAVLTITGGAMRITVRAHDLPVGAHGLHIHTVGRCDAPDFKSAGAHWNPTMKLHGVGNAMGPHQGDLPNLEVGGDRRGSVTFDLPGDPAALLDTDGASVVVHADADDYRTDPSGNSGARIACGVFVRHLGS